jgi:ATP-dependent helicase/nuclease subunit B
MKQAFTTEQWQQEILDSWRPGMLILTSGSRLSRALQHRHRLQERVLGRKGWRSMEVLSLNNWLHRCSLDLWEEKSPAGPLYRLRLWQEIASNLPPPGEISLDPGLCQALDQAYTTLVRHRLAPAGGDYFSPLLEWRRRLCRDFTAALHEAGRWHPATLPLRIAAAIRSGALPAPETVMLAGLEAPAPIEEDLFQVLSENCEVVVSHLPEGTGAGVQAVSLSDPEQEILYLGQTLVHSCQELRPGAIGVVVPNLERYALPLKKTLATLLGHPENSREATFNITLGTPLLGHPLVQAAFLPLRFLVEDEQRRHLIALLLSPYYRVWSRHRHELARLDRCWREERPDSDLEALFAAGRRQAPQLMSYLAPMGGDLLQSLAPLRYAGPCPAARWKELLESLWNSLQFPVLADEADRIALRHLQTVLTDLAVDLGSSSLDIAMFLSWCRHALAQEVFQVGASEQAGIQVLGLIEARGLTFQRLFLVGLTSTALPQPVRPLPFLSPEERRRIRGATLKSQYDFARASFHHLLAAAPEIILTRPEQVEGEPMPATRFWNESWRSAAVPLWQSPDAAWARATWLRSSWRGLTQPPQPEPEAEMLAPPIRLPETITVSALAVACRCPFRFLLEELLGLKQLSEPVEGLRPERRGQAIHKVLACITRRLRPHQEEGNLEWQRVLPDIEDCVDEVLAEVASDPFWQVERRRWLGGEHGLLRQWLEEEARHLGSGWRWLAEEIPFSGVTLEGWPVQLRGRIDRLDRHSEAGLCCWDYKSGTSPRAAEVFDLLSEPQLPAYLLALRQGLVEVGAFLENQALRAGYISLKSEKETRLHSLGADPERWQRFLETWQEHLAELGRNLQQGRFDTGPLSDAPESRAQDLCAYCGLLTLCNRKDGEGYRR